MSYILTVLVLVREALGTSASCTTQTLTLNSGGEASLTYCPPFAIGA